MADEKITDYSALGAAPATGDLLEVVDISDTAMSADGTNKRMTVANLFTSPSIASPTVTGHATIEGVTATGATGTGKFVFDGTPTLVTPVLGVATATTINKVALTAPATGSTLTIADGKTVTVSKTLTLTGTDGTTMTFPATSATIARTDAANTFTGNQTAAALFTTNLDAGASGTAGTVDIFPSTAASGKIALTAADNAGDTTTTIVNASQAGARTYTIPDAGASASFVMTEGNQTVNGTKTIPAIVTTNIDAGASGTAGTVDVFPTTAAKGKIQIAAADSAGDTTTTITNASQAGARTYTIPDAGASASFVMTAGAQTIAGAKTFTSAPDAPAAGYKADGVTLGQFKAVTVSVAAADLDAAGSKVVMTGVAGDQYKIRDIFLFGGGTNYGAGGDRLIDLTDGTTVWTTIANADIESAPAATLRWGDAKVPFLTGTANTASASAADIKFAYSGGTTDHGGVGSIDFCVLLEKVA